MSLIALVLAGAAPLAPAQSREVLMPGVSYTREVEFTPHGPVVLHVLRAPRPTGLYALEPVLSNNAVIGRERVTQMQRRLSSTATLAGVNGGTDGLVLINGVLATQANPERSSIGVAPDGALDVDRVQFDGTWQGRGQRRPIVLNRAPTPSRVALYTPAYGGSTPAAAETVELVLHPFPAAQPARDLVGVVVQAKQGGQTPIPRDGAVLVGRGANGAGRLAEEAPLGTSVIVRLTLSPDWSSYPDAIGGGPVLVRDGRPIFRANELFTIPWLATRQPRSAVGQAQDGRVMLVTVDGGRAGTSVGMTNHELALALARRGARTAIALDAGASATMAFDGELLNRPSDRGRERAVPDSLNVFYYGVYAPELPEAVVSPSGGGVAERQTLAYKLVRPSTIVARLIAPDGTQQIVDSGAKTAAGHYRQQWTAVGPEGTWRFVVDATDDLGRSSSAERTFSVNTTLSALRVEPSVVRRGGTLRAAFTLARAAQVRARVTTPGGATVALLPQRAEQPGAQSLTWRVARIRAGRYELRVTAQNAIGTVTLAAPFVVR